MLEVPIPEGMLELNTVYVSIEIFILLSVEKRTYHSILTRAPYLTGLDTIEAVKVCTVSVNSCPPAVGAHSCPVQQSVNFSIEGLLQNHWANFKSTLFKVSFEQRGYEYF